jgi:hypothetical protein
MMPAPSGKQPAGRDNMQFPRLAAAIDWQCLIRLAGSATPSGTCSPGRISLTATGDHLSVSAWRILRKLSHFALYKSPLLSRQSAIILAQIAAPSGPSISRPTSSSRRQILAPPQQQAQRGEQSPGRQPLRRTSPRNSRNNSQAHRARLPRFGQSSAN